MSNKTLSVRLTLNDKDFQTGLRKATKSMKKFGTSLKNTGKNLSTNLTLPILAVGVASVKLASDLEETKSKFNTVFSGIQQDAQSTAQNLEQNFGLSSQAALQLLGDTGDLLTGFGFTQTEALNLSNEVNKLAVDLASFTNFSGGAEGASLALTKALLGERESIKSLGIAITEADLKSYAADQGLVFKELDRVAKAQLTFQLAAEQSKNAIGDFGRTSESFANQLRILKGDAANLGAELGAILLPIALKIVEKVRDLAKSFSSLSTEQKETILKVAGLVAVLGPLLVVVGSIAGAISTLIPIVVGLVAAFNPLVAIGIGVAAGLTFLADKMGFFGDETEDVSEDIDDVIGQFEKLENALPTKDKTIARPTLAGIAPKKGLSVPINLELPEDLGTIKDEIDNTLESFSKAFFDFSDDFKQSLQDAFSFIGEIASQVSGIVSQMYEAQTIKAENAHAKEMEILTRSKDFALMTEEQKATAIAKVDDKLANKKKEIQKKQAKADKRAAMFQAIVNTASAVVAALPNLPLSILAGVLGATQIAAIASTPIPAFADGGLVTGATMGLVGEGPGTSMSNPEVIAPLDKLKGMIGGGHNVVVTGKLSGEDIYFSNQKTSQRRNSF